MDHPLHHQPGGSHGHQYQQQQQQYAPQNSNAQDMSNMNMNMMQHQHGSPQIIGSPMMTANNYMHQQMQRQNQQQYSPHPQPPQQMYHPHQQQGQQQQPIMHHPSQQTQTRQHQQYNLTHSQSLPYPNSPTPSIPATSSSGPKSKCDQVIYEALAKACEIAVRGRCTDTDILLDETTDPSRAARRGYSPKPTSTTATDNNTKRRSWNYGGNTANNQNQNSSSSSSNNSGGSSTNSNSTSSRFNIEVNEVPQIRTIVSNTWKRNPHLPLRLDIYYEHDVCYQEGGLSDEQNEIAQGDDGRSEPPPPPSQPQRELLERWCIDYIPNHSTSNNNHNHNHNHNQNNNIGNSLSSSPSNSPYSSRVMTGVKVGSSRSQYYNDSNNTNKSSSSGSMSQLRAVCKRIVVLLRSLHCLTRMLPAYRLKCLLLNHIASSNKNNNNNNAMMGVGCVAVNNGLFDAMPQTNNIGGNNTTANTIGWGSIGFSIHVAEYEVEPSLPSPSFARQSFPAVPTPYGNLCLSVLYDATLNPNHMVADLVEKRSLWIQQRQWANNVGGQVQQRQPLQYQQSQQQQQQQCVDQHSKIPSPLLSSSTQPIPISQVQKNEMPVNFFRGKEHQQQEQQQHVVNSLGSQGIFHGPREYASCPPTHLMGGLSTSAGGHRTRVVSDFIIKDYHNSPRLGPVSAPASKTGSPATRGLVGAEQKLGKGGEKRVMSGLSLAMMNQDDNTSPVEHTPNETQHAVQGGAEVEEDIMLPFGSPATRAAFHNPPPLYPDENSGQKASSMADNYDSNNQGGGTHFFQRHGGYGYGYNGSNMQFDPQQMHPVGSLPGSAAGSLTGRSRSRSGSINDVGLSMSPSPFASGTPPTIQQGISSASSRSPHSSAHQMAMQYPPPLSPGGSQQQHQLIRGTPPTSMYMRHPSTGSGSLHNSPTIVKIPQYPSASSQYNNYPGAMSNTASAALDNSQRKRSSVASSVALLPPVTSLDTLQKSPFLVTRKSANISPAENEAFLSSSIPRGVSYDNRGNSSIAMSTLGGGSSNNPLMMRGSTSHSGGGSNSTERNASNNSTSSSGHGGHKTEMEELPFAVDDDSNNPLVAVSSSKSPSKGGSRSLWGSTKADTLEATLGAGGTSAAGSGGGIAEITSSLAVSSLAHRCATDGKIRLKMFDSTRTVESSAAVPVGIAEDGEHDLTPANAPGDPTSDFALIREQLSDFRSFGASLMVDSQND